MKVIPKSRLSALFQEEKNLDFKHFDALLMVLNTIAHITSLKLKG